MTQITVCGKACRAWGPPPVPCGRMPGPGAGTGCRAAPQAVKPLWGTPPGHWSGAAPRGPRRATGPARLGGRPSPPRAVQHLGAGYRATASVTAPRDRLPHLGIGRGRAPHPPQAVKPLWGTPPGHRSGTAPRGPRASRAGPRRPGGAAPRCRLPRHGVGYRTSGSGGAGCRTAPQVVTPLWGTPQRHGSGAAPQVWRLEGRPSPPRGYRTSGSGTAPGPRSPRRRAPGSPGAYRTGTVRRLRGHRSAGTA